MVPSISDDGCTMQKYFRGYCEMEVVITNTGDSESQFSLDVKILQNGQLLIIEMMYFFSPGSSEAMAISCSIAEGASSIYLQRLPSI